MSQVSYGTITITDTNDIESIVIEYNKNQSNQNPPSEGDSNWSTNRPTWQQGYYIWQRARIHKSGTATTADIIGTPVCVTGSTGEQGQPGTAGRSLTGVETKYCIYSTGTPSDSYSGWQDTIPEYNSSTPNYWVKVTNTYSSAPTTEVVKYKDTGITNAMAKAADAQSKAATAETNAASALSLSQATQQHFWFNSVKTGNIEAGAYITDVVIDSFKPNKSGNYLLAGSNGIELGNGSHPYMQLTTSELNFFHPNSSTIDAQLSSNGLIVKSGGIEAGTVGQDGGIYLSTENYGTTHNNQTITINGHEAANWRQIIGKNFGVDKAGNLYASGANIQGKITITSGSNVYTKTEADAAYDAKGAASAVQTNIEGVAVQEEQYIYISKASGTASVSGTTTWITEAGDKQNTWSTKRPTYNSSYPVLFVAKQKKVVSGTVTCTTPVKDDTTTIIDGGHITTGTIDASKATIKNISASMFTSSEQEKILNSKIEIGGRNLVWDTEWNHISTHWSDWDSPTTREIVTINGKRWLHLVTTASSYQGYSQAPDKRNGYGEIKAGDKVIISYSAYAKTAGQKCAVGCNWMNSSGTIVAQIWFVSTLTTTEKRYTSGVFTIPNDAVGFNVMVGDETANVQELWISQVKIEFGTKATDWSPAPEDIQSNAKDYADTVASTVAYTAKAELDATKIDVVGESTSLLDNINAISDQITLLASRINFGNITVADNLAQLNTAVSIDTATSTVYVGDQSSFHVRIDGTELGFYQGAQRVAYINNNQLYITQSVVLQQMDLGMPVGFVNPVTGEVGKGQWSWKVHPNGQNPSRNNLNLKWIG